jgi:hypothetical protein
MALPGDPTHPAQPDPEDGEEASRCLAILRDGDPDQQLDARANLARIFEGRGLLAEAAELLETNARLGPEDAALHVRLASLYRRQSRPDLAQQAIARAAALTHPPETEPPPKRASVEPPSATSPTPAPAPPRRRHARAPLLVGALGGSVLVALSIVWAGWYCGDCLDPSARLRSSMLAPTLATLPSPATAAPLVARPTSPPTIAPALSTATREATVTPAEQSTAASPAPLPSPPSTAVATEPLTPSPSATPTAPSAARAAPQGINCPPDRPIKGNQGSRSTNEWIYHVPSGRSYAVTVPEECFATEAQAQRAGYRRSLR